MSGTINKGSVVVPPLLQEKEVNPSYETEIVVADEDYNGLSKVTVNPFQDDCFHERLDNLDTVSIYRYIKRVSKIDLSNQTSAMYFFNSSPYLVEVGELNTTGVNNFNGIFDGNLILETIPIFDTSSATSMNGMFSNCRSLTDKSVDNILVMCANATSYTGTKTLQRVGFNSGTMTRIYPASRIQALPHYQDFLDAGWTIGY